MKQLYPDLWQTRMEQPHAAAPDLKTRAYLIVRPDGNVLLYSTGLQDEHQAIVKLGGVRWQYLSHVDEAGPALAELRRLFGNELRCHAAEAEAVQRASGVAPDHTFNQAERDLDGALEVLPLPGHTAGSTAFLYSSTEGRRYLFTGDTIGRNDHGVWTAGLLPFSDKAALMTTLQRMAELEPDVVLSSAFGTCAVTELTPEGWRAAVDQALAPLLGHTSSRALS